MSGSGRKLLVMRHAERLDQVFPEWHKLAFTTGSYRSYDLNMPTSVFHRAESPASWELDTPITVMGEFSAKLIVKSLKDAGQTPTQIFASPSTRCVQTAQVIARVIDPHMRVQIEPGLFEWLAYTPIMPLWMTTDEFIDAGINVATDYRPFIPAKRLQKEFGDETVVRHYQRVMASTQQIIKQTGSNSITLIVGHAGSIDAVGRGLLGKEPVEQSESQMENVGNHNHYCSIVGLAELSNGQWRLDEQPIPPLTSTGIDNSVDWVHFKRP